MKSAQLVVIALLLTNLIWGVSAPLIKVTLSEVPPFTFAFLRFAIASLILSPLFIIKGIKIKFAKKDFIPLTLITFLGPPLTLGFFLAGLYRTSAVTTGAIHNLLPLFSLIAAFLILREAINRWNVLGFLVALAGSFIIVGQPFLGNGGDGEQFLGNLLIVASIICWSLYTSLIKRFNEKYHYLAITAYSFLLVVLVFAPLSVWEFLKDPSWIFGISSFSSLNIFYMALFPTLVANFLYEYSVEKAPVKLVAIFNYLQPLTIIALAIIFLGEKITPLFVLGSTLIVGGVLISTLTHPHHHKTKSHRV